MKIVLIIHHKLTKNAGAAGVVLSLVAEYRQLGHDVAILSYDTFKLPMRLRRLAFPFLCAAMLWSRHRYADVIDASSGTAWLYFWLARQKGRGLYVTHSHGLTHVLHDVLMENVRAGRASVSWKYALYNGSLALQQDAFSFRSADLSLFLNRNDAQYAISRLGVSERKVEIVQNGLNDAFLEAADALSKDVRLQRNRIVQVGSYIERKGIRTTSEAMRLVMERRPAVGITFLGTQTSYERVTKDYPQKLHPNVQIISTFQNSALPRYLGQHDILIMPSQSEGFPLAAIEAMACGLVPIVTNIPGPTEFVTHRENGLVVPPNDPQALAVAIEELIDDGDLYERLRDRARTTAFALRWTTIAAARIELYQRYLERRKVTTLKR